MIHGCLNSKLSISASTDFEQLLNNSDYTDIVTKWDDLCRLEKRETVLNNFVEPSIKFAPTSLYVKGTNRLDYTRAPAWPDRILATGNMKALGYNLAEINLSRHKPVIAHFEFIVPENDP